MATYIKFETPSDEVIGPTFGPYPYIQLTYEELRVGPDGAVLALWNGSEWELTSIAIHLSDRTNFSDVIIFA